MIEASFMSYISLSILLFSLGIIGLVSRKNIFIIYMSIELMLNAINLMLVTLSKYFASMDGQIIAMMVMAIAASEAAVFLSLIVAMFRLKHSVNIDDYNELKQEDTI
jgi:NADH-quinone oxidoreductase subunit K